MLNMRFPLFLIIFLSMLVCIYCIDTFANDGLQPPPQTPQIQPKQQPESALKSKQKTDHPQETTNNFILTPINHSNELKKYSQEDTKKRTEDGTEFCVLYGYRFKISDLFLIAFTFALVLCTAILAWIAYGQYRATILSQRAFVFLKRIDCEPIMLRRGLEGYKEGQYWMFSPCWQNSGETSTKNLTIRMNNAVFNYEIDKNFAFPYDNIKGIPMVIGPKSEIIVGEFAKPFYSSIEDLKDSQFSNLYIWGEAKYNDVFGKAHRTCFCVKMLFLGQQIVGKHDVPTFIYYDKYNCADEDCDEQS